MCLSCGCGKPNDDHGDSRNITLDDINQAAEAAGTTRDRVLQNIMSGSSSQMESSSSQEDHETRDVRGSSSDQLMGSSKQQGKPGEYAPSLGQESGTAWQESQQMGYTGHGGVQNPQEG
jgi:hypothetical protein